MCCHRRRRRLLLQDPNHRLSVPLIEAALAVMRLSTEKFFVLLSLYVAFLLFRTPPPAVACLISITARISNAFARMVLYTFPCVCWVYGAGFVFSTLVSGEHGYFRQGRPTCLAIGTMQLLLCMALVVRPPAPHGTTSAPPTCSLRACTPVPWPRRRSATQDPSCCCCCMSCCVLSQSCFGVRLSGRYITGSGRTPAPCLSRACVPQQQKRLSGCTMIVQSAGAP